MRATAGRWTRRHSFADRVDQQAVRRVDSPDPRRSRRPHARGPGQQPAPRLPRAVASGDAAAPAHAHLGDDPLDRPTGLRALACRWIPGERLALLLEAPLHAPPGSQWCYSSPGYMVLSAVLETVTERPYAQLVTEEIIEPLGLGDTTVGRSTVSNGALGYRGGERVTPWDLHTMPGTGDIWSTADDIARFVAARYDGDLTPGSARAALLDVRVDQGMWESSGPDTRSVGTGSASSSAPSAAGRPTSTPATTRATSRSPGGYRQTRSAVVVLGNDEERRHRRVRRRTFSARSRPEPAG